MKNALTNALVKQYVYANDDAGNRTSERARNKTTTAIPNNVNQLVSQSGAVNRTLAYDLNGSLIDDGSRRTFEWDEGGLAAALCNFN